MPEENTPSLRLTNIYADCDSTEKLVANVSREHYNYFFKGNIAGYRGGAQSIMSQLFQAFHNHCLTVTQLPEYWDPIHPSLIASVLQHVNFHDQRTLLDRITFLESELANTRGTNVRRRADSGTAVDKSKPVAPKRKRATTSGDSPQSQDNGNDTSAPKATVAK